MEIYRERYDLILMFCCLMRDELYRAEMKKG